MSLLADTELSTSAIGLRPTDVGATLSWFRHGRYDPTTLLRQHGRGPTSSGVFVRASHTSAGPATLQLGWQGGRSDRAPDITIRSWGPGGQLLEASVPGLLGNGDPGPRALLNAPHRVLAEAAQRHRHVRLGWSGDLYRELLPTILEQRITSGEAHRQWQRLCQRLGEPAPGPHRGLRVPPSADRLAHQPSWWFHPLGIERTRAETLIAVARHADKLWRWGRLDPIEAAQMIRKVRGVGRWTAGTVGGPALGDPDAVAVGDYHLKNLVAFALAGRPRGTDEEMLGLLAPYAGNRGRVIRLLELGGHGTPKFGPRRRIPPMERW
jgi:endonuclease III